MKYIYIYLLTILFAVGSCKQKEIPKWETLSIRTDQSSIEVHSASDSLVLSTWIYKTKRSGDRIEYIPIDRKEKRFKIKSSTKDSIYELIHEIITNPVFIEGQVSEFKSNSFFSIREKSTEISCSYFSCRTWATISPETEKLYNITSKVTNSY